MSKKYSCEICIYETNRLSDHKKHLQTKKHIKNARKNSTKNVDDTTKNVDKTTKNVDAKLKCIYCNKFYSRIDSLKRHKLKCKLKDKKLIENKQKKYEEKTKLLEKKLEEEKLERLKYEQKTKEIEEERNQIIMEKEKQMKEIEAEKNQILQQFNEYLLKLWDEKTKPQIINNNIQNNINVEQLTIRYVRKNFTDAYNYEDLMDPLLDNNEIKLIEKSPITGCYELLKNRCIDSIDIDKRPIHLVDKSRRKYALRKDNQWITDEGDLILKEVDKKVSWIIKGYDLNIKNDREKQMNILQMMVSDQYKILDYLNDDIILKENVNLIKA